MLKQLWQATRRIKRIFRGNLTWNPAVPIKPYVGIRTYREYTTASTEAIANGQLGRCDSNGLQPPDIVVRYFSDVDEEKYVEFAGKLVDSAYHDAIIALLKRNAQLYRKAQHEAQAAAQMRYHQATRPKSNSICQMNLPSSSYLTYTIPGGVRGHRQGSIADPMAHGNRATVSVLPSECDASLSGCDPSELYPPSAHSPNMTNNNYQTQRSVPSPNQNVCQTNSGSGRASSSNSINLPIWSAMDTCWMLDKIYSDNINRTCNSRQRNISVSGGSATTHTVAASCAQNGSSPFTSSGISGCGIQKSISISIPPPPPPEPAVKCNGLSLDTSFLQLPSFHPKPKSMYTFRCGLDFRSDEYAAHYHDVHASIQGGLDGWLEHRCPMFQYGCSWVHTRWGPCADADRKVKQTIVFSELLETFGVTNSDGSTLRQQSSNNAGEPHCNGFNGDDFNLFDKRGEFLYSRSRSQTPDVPYSLDDFPFEVIYWNRSFLFISTFPFL